MDTVPVSGPIEPVVEDGVVRNRADTILGADDKAAVAVLLQAARTLLSERPHAGIELLFTVREEIGLEGAKAFDETRLKSRTGYVYDYSGQVGDVVVAAPSGRQIDVAFRGRLAHAGIAPEEGRSAVFAAAAVADSASGESTTRRPPTSAASRVARRATSCPSSAPLRQRRARATSASSPSSSPRCSTPSRSQRVAECEVATKVEESYRGYRLRADDPAVRLASRPRTGWFPPRAVDVGGGADANVFNARGLACVNLANGMRHVHTAEEEIAVDDLDAMLRVTLELVEAARSA